MIWKVLTGVGLFFSVSYGVAAAQQHRATQRLIAAIPDDRMTEIWDRSRR